MSIPPRHRTIVSCTLLVMSLAAATTACSEGGSPLSGKPYDATGQLVVNGPAGARKADPTKPLTVTVKQGEARITDVTVSDEAGRQLAGVLGGDGARWQNTAPLSAGVRYTVSISTENTDGSPGRRTLRFDTEPPKDKERLKITLGPEAGTYGVGQPVTAELSQGIDEKDKEARSTVERGLQVVSTPPVDGAWHWADDKTLHYRPKDYWPAHSTVRVRSNLRGIRIKDKLYAEGSPPLKLAIGEKVEAVTDAAGHFMTVSRDDEVVNTIPVTTGKPGFETRNGIKVVLGKEYYVRMRGTSIGIGEGSSDSYDLPVYWATRVTWSGEYVHAAPWSVAQQGAANVSHGCTGMSTGNAEWFFDNVREGDIVRVINSYGDDMEPFGNGYGDWNLSWKDWRAGSALLAGTREGRSPLDTARLRPQV